MEWLSLPRRWRYAAAGCLLALGAPAGLVVVRWLQGEGAMTADVITADLPAFAYVTASTVVVFALFGFVLGRQADELQRRLSVDALTGLLDRLAFLAELDHENDRSRRYAAPLAVALLDVDGLKAINDRGGHRAGDAALRALIGDAIRDGLRASDRGGRVGGDEFAVLAPESDEQAAAALAERIRARAERAQLPGLPLTVSIGVACAAGGRPWTPDEILERADRALYEAKRTGRNRVVLDHLKEVSS